MADGLGVDAWWHEPEYKPCNTLRLRGLFILRKLREHDAAKFNDVMTDLYEAGGHWHVRVADHPGLPGREPRGDHGRPAADWAGVAVSAARTARLLLAAFGLLALATSVSAQEGACEWRFNVGDHLIASKDGSDLGVVVRRAEKHRFSSGAIGCAYIVRTSSGRNPLDDARPATVLNQIAKVAPPPPECSWRFNVGDFVVNRNNGMELGVVVRREPRHRFPNGRVGCAYFMRTGPGPDLSKWNAEAIDRIGTRP